MSYLGLTFKYFCHSGIRRKIYSVTLPSFGISGMVFFLATMLTYNDVTHLCCLIYFCTILKRLILKTVKSTQIAKKSPPSKHPDYSQIAED